MRRLHYAGGTVLIGDATCKAMLRYARALAEADASDVVTVPVLSETSGFVDAHFLIGPASQLYSTSADQLVLEPEPDDRELVEALEVATRRLQPSRPEWDEEMPDISGADAL